MERVAMYVMRALVGAFSALLIQSGAAGAKKLCGQDVVAFDKMATNIRALPGASVTQETSSVTDIADEKQFTLWTLVKPQPGEPAAIICRKIIQEDGRVVVQLNAECLGTTLGCDGVISRVLAQQNRTTAPLRR